jgi:hypothetical protein
VSLLADAFAVRNYAVSTDSPVQNIQVVRILQYKLIVLQYENYAVSKDISIQNIQVVRIWPYWLMLLLYEITQLVRIVQLKVSR